jgi:DNA-binding NtrC family response regulator
MNLEEDRNLVMIVDDNQRRREKLINVLQERGISVIGAESGLQARANMERHNPAGLVVELDMKDDDSLFVLKTAQSFESPPRVIAKSEFGSVSQAVQAMQFGAATVLQSPLNIDLLFEQLERIVQLPPQAASNPWIAETPEPRPSHIERNQRLMRGHSDALERLYRMISRVAPNMTNVLVTGESGVGKELIAQEIHCASLRKEGPLVTVNCAAIPDNLLESELFGHKKGAFTNATSDREGRFRQAEGGTIFLDEIGEMKLDLQAKLLRVLQEREFQPVGSNETIKGDFRVIAATNQELESLVEEGNFRKDLYYRLSVFPIQIAPLRERKVDIPELVEHFIVEFNDDRMTEISGIGPSIMDALTSYSWPGNIRELRNVVERMVILGGEGELQYEDLPDRFFKQAPPELPTPEVATTGTNAPSFALPSNGLNLKAAVLAYEVSLIKQALLQTSGNKNQAAQLLHINRTTLVEKIKRLKISP